MEPHKTSAERPIHKEIWLALGIVFGFTGLLAVIQLVVPATASWMQVALAVILIQVPGWVLRKTRVDQDALGLTVGRWGRALTLGLTTMAIVFPVFVLGFHLVQTQVMDRQAHWDADRMVRWDERLEQRPEQPCGRAEADTLVWTGGKGLWLVGPAASQLQIEVQADPPVTRARAVACIPGRMPEARGAIRPNKLGVYRLGRGTGLWLPLGDRGDFRLAIRDARGIPIEAEHIKLGRHGVSADDDGAVEGERSLWWLLTYLIVHLGLVALPEEWFFRGYLQGRIDQAAGTPLRVLGADVGWGLVLAALSFALLHPILLPGAHRLLVFFPALLFGWLRARSGNVGAAILVHAGSNLLLAIISRMYT